MNLYRGVILFCKLDFGDIKLNRRSKSYMKPKRINWKSKWYTWLFVPTKTEEKFEDLVLLLLVNIFRFFINNSIKNFHKTGLPMVIIFRLVFKHMN